MFENHSKPADLVILKFKIIKPRLELLYRNIDYSDVDDRSKMCCVSTKFEKCNTIKFVLDKPWKLRPHTLLHIFTCKYFIHYVLSN